MRHNRSCLPINRGLKHHFVIGIAQKWLPKVPNLHRLDPLCKFGQEVLRLHHWEPVFRSLQHFLVLQDDRWTRDGYAVFHASQIDGIPAYKAPTVEEAPWTRPEAADIILKNSGAVVRIGGDRAFYSPVTDHIQLPPEHAFRGPPEFAATALHELAHWTGHPSRLARDLQSRFGSTAYAMEELRAELASAFVAAELGIPTDIPHHASYIASWVRPLKEDKREIFRAAADAQRIADMQLGFHPVYAAQVKASLVAPALHPGQGARSPAPAP